MKSRTDRTWGCKYQTWFPDDPLAMDSWADGSPTDLEQQPLVTDYSLVGPQPWVLPMCKQLGRASRYDRSWGCHVDCVKWGKVMRKCFVNHRSPSRWQVTIITDQSLRFQLGFDLHIIILTLLWNVNWIGKTFGLIQGKKANSRCMELLFCISPCPEHCASLYFRVLQSGGGGSSRGKHNYIWCDMCCNHCMCSLGKW